MIYRPQFAYATPPGCRDLDYVYFFDGSNTPMLNQNFSGVDLSAPTGGIPLVLEQDAPFFWRALKVNAFRKTSGGNPSSYVNPNCTVRFKDCYENFLSDDMVPAIQYGYPANSAALNNGLPSGIPVPITEIYTPPGGVVWFYIKVPTLGAGSFFPQVALYGVKRFKECQ